MQARVREKIVEFGMPGLVAGMLTRKIPKLARWQKRKPGFDKIKAQSATPRKSLFTAGSKLSRTCLQFCG